MGRWEVSKDRTSLGGSGEKATREGDEEGEGEAVSVRGSGNEERMVSIFSAKQFTKSLGQREEGGGRAGGSRREEKMEKKCWGWRRRTEF